FVQRKLRSCHRRRDFDTDGSNRRPAAATRQRRQPVTPSATTLCGYLEPHLPEPTAATSFANLRRSAEDACRAWRAGSVGSQCRGILGRYRRYQVRGVAGTRSDRRGAKAGAASLRDDREGPGPSPRRPSRAGGSLLCCAPARWPRRQPTRCGVRDELRKPNRAGGPGLGALRSSSLDAWSRWAQALVGVATFQYEHGEVSAAIATARSALALAHDPHSPKGLAAVTGYIWLGLIRAQTLSGDSAGANQSLQAYLRNLDGFATGFLPPGSPERLLAAGAMNQLLTGGQLKLDEGAAESALTQVTAARAMIASIEVPAADVGATRLKNRNLEASLNAAARAAVQLGRYAQAETLARQWL